MAYTPGYYSQQLNIPNFYTTSQNTFDVTYNSTKGGYSIYWASLNTDKNGRIKRIGASTEGAGYRIDVNDERDIFTLGDQVTINSKKYTVQEIVTPPFTPNSGKMVATQNITDNPIEVFPSTKRTYRFDISININEV